MASNNIHTQFILRQQEYINVQQQYLEKLLLNNDQNQKLLTLEEEMKLLKLKFQCLNANTNKQHAYFITQIKLLKKENAKLNHKMEKLIAENSILEQIENDSLNLVEESVNIGEGNTDAGEGNIDAGEGNTDTGEGNTDAGEGNTDLGEGQENNEAPMDDL